VTDNAIALFRDEYKLPLIDPALAANIAAFSEHCPAFCRAWREAP
jgi:putative oxidoreductase